MSNRKPTKTTSLSPKAVILMQAIQRHGGQISRAYGLVYTDVDAAEMATITRELRERGLISHGRNDYALTEAGHEWLESNRREVADAVLCHAVKFAPCSAFSMATSGWHRRASARKS